MDLLVIYSVADDRSKRDLAKQIKILATQGFICSSTYRTVEDPVAQTPSVDEFDAVVVLLSSDLLASGFVSTGEMIQAMKRHESGDAVVIPILVRDCSWEASQFKNLSILPASGRPVNRERSRDRAWTMISRELHQTLRLRNLDASSSMSGSEMSQLRINEARRVQARRHISRTGALEDLAALRIADVSDVTEWGWDGDRLLDELIRLDFDVIAGLVEAHEGSTAQWSPVFMDHPDTWRLLTNARHEILGYWHFVPLFPGEMDSARRGCLLDSEITTNVVRLFEIPGRYDIYFITLCLRPEYRRPLPFNLLLGSFVNVVKDLATEGVFINELWANAYTQSGVSICRSFQMQFVCAHREKGDIYFRRFHPFEDLRFLRSDAELGELYAAEFDSANSQSPPAIR